MAVLFARSTCMCMVFTMNSADRIAGLSSRHRKPGTAGTRIVNKASRHAALRQGKRGHQTPPLDFRRYDKDGVPAEVVRIDVDLLREARVARLRYADGERRYILAPKGLKKGATVTSGPFASIQTGNNLPLSSIPAGTVVHAVEMRPGAGATIARSPGASVLVLGMKGRRVQLLLASQKIATVDSRCRATIGELAELAVLNPFARPAGGLQPKGRMVEAETFDTRKGDIYGKIGFRVGGIGYIEGAKVGAYGAGKFEVSAGKDAARRAGKDLGSALKALAAQKFLLDLDERRVIQTADSEGMTQTEIGKHLGVSQPTIHRVVRQLDAAPEEVDQRTVREIIAEAVAGIIDRDTMMAELKQRDPKPGEFPSDSSVEGYVLGEWDEVVDAWELGWLTDDEYEQLAGQ